MRTSWLVIVVAVALGACKNDKQAWEQAESDLVDIYGKMCGCTEQQCVDDVQKRLQAWNDKVGKDAKPPPDIEKLLAQTHTCADTVATRGVIAKLRSYKDRMCACKDAACAKGVADGGEQAKRDAEDNMMISDDDRSHKVPELYQELQACQAKLTGSATP